MDSPNSLKTIASRKIVSKFFFHMTYDQDLLTTLPSNLKKNILKILLAPGKRYPKEKIKVEDILGILRNDITEAINLESADYNNDIILERISKFKNLKRVVLPSIEGVRSYITHQGLIRFFETSPQLKEVTITNEDNVTDEVLKSITNCEELKLLDLSGCSKITDKGIEHIKDMELRCINLSKTAISDDGLILLIEGKCHHTLMELKLDNCQNITLQSIRAVACHCALDYFSYKYIGEDISGEDIIFKRLPKDVSFWCNF